MMDSRPTFTRRPKTCSGLVVVHLPRPIHARETYDNAVEFFHALAGHKLNHDQDDWQTHH